MKLIVDDFKSHLVLLDLLQLFVFECTFHAKDLHLVLENFVDACRNQYYCIIGNREGYRNGYCYMETIYLREAQLDR